MHWRGRCCAPVRKGSHTMPTSFVAFPGRLTITDAAGIADVHSASGAAVTPTIPRDRAAPADGEIEITSEMIEAGGQVLAQSAWYDGLPEMALLVAEEIIRAALAVSAARQTPFGPYRRAR